MQTWNCIWELAEEGKIKEKVKYRGTHPCFRDCCKNPSDENRATAKIPKKSCKWNRESASAPLTFESKGDGWQPQKNDDVTFSLQNSDFEGDFKTSENGNLNNSIFWFCQICAHICSPLWYLDWNSSMHKHWGKVGGQLGKSKIWKPRRKFTVFDQFRGHDLKALAGGCWQIVLICFKLTAVVQLRRLARLVAFVGAIENNFKTGAIENRKSF